MTAVDMTTRLRARAERARPAVKEALGPFVRPLLIRLYARVDARASAAVQAAAASQAGGLDALREQLELARAAVAAADAAAREVRREQLALADRLDEIERRLDALSADRPDEPRG
jgi:chromosome segregation ATPase